jgi:hypothetical protein
MQGWSTPLNQQLGTNWATNHLPVGHATLVLWHQLLGWVSKCPLIRILPQQWALMKETVMLMNRLNTSNNVYRHVEPCAHRTRNEQQHA